MRASRPVIVLLAAVLLGGCSAATAGQPATPRDALGITCDDLAIPSGVAAAATVERTVKATVGETIRITLCSNPSTGFSWELPVLPASAAVALADHAVVAPDGAPVGAAGSQTFTFQVRAPGTTEIPFAYSQPWAGGTKGAWSVRLTVVAS
jgi:predicted secreted protein